MNPNVFEYSIQKSLQLRLIDPAAFSLFDNTNVKMKLKDGVKNELRNKTHGNYNQKDNEQANADFFLDNSRKILSNIPGLKDFEVSKQVSVKNNFQYGFSMFFENEDMYKAYNEHTDHTDCVKSIWLKDVEEFMEIDFKLL